MSNEKITINTDDLSTEPIASSTESSTQFQPVQTECTIPLQSQQIMILSHKIKFVVILLLLNFLLTLALCVGVGYLAFYQPDRPVPQPKQKRERKWEPEPPIKPETSLSTKTNAESVPKQNETTPIDEKPIKDKAMPKTETEKPTATQPTSDDLPQNM
jgi:hypothetical protein